MDETLKTGEWIVHKKYGVGQVKGLERKIIGGEAREYFRVKISTGFYWLPIQHIPDRIRFISSKSKLLKALQAISEKPHILPKDYRVRNKQVAERAEEATLQGKGELIRDLSARKYLEGSNMSIVDERQLESFSQQFMREMAVILDITLEEAEIKLNRALDESIKFLEQE